MSGSGRRSVSSQEFLDLVLEPGTFRSWDTTPEQPLARGTYAQELVRARDRSGIEESVRTGEGRIGGQRVAVIVSEFTFLAGSVGVAASRRIVAAVERATRERLPLLAAPASGGTRMQEGTPAFVHLMSVTAALRRHRDAGLAYVVYLRHPTTGGATASWGSLGHVTLAEPGALIGFLGPRVYEALHGQPFPQGVQRAENLQRHGVVDAVVDVHDLGKVLAHAVGILAPPTTGPAPPSTVACRPDRRPAWERIEISRSQARPGTRELVEQASGGWLPLSGTGTGERDETILLAVARFGGMPCLLVGHARPRPGQSPPGPAALRTARRGIALAGELGLPVVTVIDTAGADLSAAAEHGALAGEIARTMDALVATPTAVVSVLLGQGSGGGAMALLPADRVIAASNSWLSPLPPEGASAILHRTVDRAPELAATQRVGVDDLWALGVVDHLVDERPDAAAEPEAFCRRVADAIEFELGALVAQPAADRRSARMAALGAWTVAGARSGEDAMIGG